jgi:hypothetical protein
MELLTDPHYSVLPHSLRCSTDRWVDEESVGIDACTKWWADSRDEFDAELEAGAPAVADTAGREADNGGRADNGIEGAGVGTPALEADDQTKYLGYNRFYGRLNNRLFGFTSAAYLARTLNRTLVVRDDTHLRCFDFRRIFRGTTTIDGTPLRVVGAKRFFDKLNPSKKVLQVCVEHRQEHDHEYHEICTGGRRT